MLVVNKPARVFVAPGRFQAATAQRDESFPGLYAAERTQECSAVRLILASMRQGFGPSGI